MVNAIGASVMIPAVAPGGGRATGSLEARLAKCELQLADWNGCADGKTPEGRRKIELISAQISDLKLQIRSQEAPVANETTSNGAGAAADPLATLGGRVDVFA